jgi:hypothetical protein
VYGSSGNINFIPNFRDQYFFRSTLSNFSGEAENLWLALGIPMDNSVPRMPGTDAIIACVANGKVDVDDYKIGMRQRLFSCPHGTPYYF